jgi:hypothetical protein
LDVASQSLTRLSTSALSVPVKVLTFRLRILANMKDLVVAAQPGHEMPVQNIVIAGNASFPAAASTASS